MLNSRKRDRSDDAGSSAGRALLLPQDPSVERGRQLLCKKIGDEPTARWVTDHLRTTHAHDFAKAVRLVVKAVCAAEASVPLVASGAAALQAFVATAIAPRDDSVPTASPRVLVAELQPVHITPPMAQDAERFALLVGGVFSADECAHLIERTEAVGYREATMSVTGGGSVLRRDIRDNDRCILTDSELATKLWGRLRARGALPEQLEGGALRATRLNERLRFYRYESGQSFSKHMDDAYTAESGEASRLTVLLYLNGGFDGGGTRLCTWQEPDERAIEVLPSAGAAFVFDHKLLHSSTPCVRGRKYVMRSDVMYENRQASRVP